MKTITLLLLFLFIFFVVFQLYITWSIAKTKSQSYQKITQMEGFDIRFYPSATLAQITSSASRYKEVSRWGFRKLAGYIFGNNQSRTKIAMTSPVHIDMNAQQSSMSFVMPSVYEADELPEPIDTNVKITQSEQEYVAVLRFGGFANHKKIEKNQKKLKSLLAQQGISTLGNYRFLGYNPPYQLLGRRNEIAVRIHWPL